MHASHRRSFFKAKVVAVCILLAVACVAVATIVPRVALNPRDTDAVIFGKVRVLGDGGGAAFLNLSPHSIVPHDIPHSGLFIVRNATDRLICVRDGGSNFCLTANLVE